jgi:hypothetical protein
MSAFAPKKIIAMLSGHSLITPNTPPGFKARQYHPEKAASAKKRTYYCGVTWKLYQDGSNATGQISVCSRRGHFHIMAFRYPILLLQRNNTTWMALELLSRIERKVLHEEQQLALAKSRNHFSCSIND